MNMNGIEVFYAGGDIVDLWNESAPEEEEYREGYYWWACFPGCLPDSDPIGPFETREEALEDIRGGH